MVVDYLKKKQKQYIDANTDRHEQLDRLGTDLLETDKFLELLRSESDNFFTDFTPRDINNKNAKKIDELEEKRAGLLERKEQIESDIERDELFLKDVNKALAEIKKLQRDSEKLRKKVEQLEKNREGADGSEKKEETVDSSTEDSAPDRIEEKSENKEVPVNAPQITRSDIDRILSYLPADPMRARLELVEIKEKCL